MASRAPKQWCLTDRETITSFESWKQNLEYTLSLDPGFAPFIHEGVSWLKRSRTQPLRGFTSDGNDIPAAERRTAANKVYALELMLGQIANYCPVISRNTIVKNSTSLAHIWQSIRQHFGFQVSGAQFIDFDNIRMESDERPETLFQRLTAFIEDSLLRPGGLTHHGEFVAEEEELSPTLENLVVLTWLRLIHPGLPALVRQRYGTELRSRTLASIRPEISQALSSLLEEVRTADDARSLRATARAPRSQPAWRPNPRFGPRSSDPEPVGSRFGPDSLPRRSRRDKSCPLCQQAGRKDTRHFLSECSYLPESDRQYMVKARQIMDIVAAESDEYSGEDDTRPREPVAEQLPPGAVSYRVQTRQSPYFDVFYGHYTVRVTLDSGATGNMIRHATAVRLGLRITPSAQSVHQADGSSPLRVMGETRTAFTRNGKELRFEGLVVADLDVEVLAGTPFMEAHDITIRPAKREVSIGDDATFVYGSAAGVGAAARRAFVLRAPPQANVIWPGGFIELQLPEGAESDADYAIEPRTDAVRRSDDAQLWPRPDIVSSVAGRIRIANLSPAPQPLRRHEHFCQVSPVFEPEVPAARAASTAVGEAHAKRVPIKSVHASAVRVDPNELLQPGVAAQFRSLHKEYDAVFDPEIKGYNGAAGPFFARVNMGPVEPPQRKGRLPLYARGKLLELQSKFDELEQLGVFAHPEDVNVAVEYLNPSFLVKKPNGGARLVTAFADVGRYSKPQPSLLPDVDSTLRQIARWRHIIITDLTSAFYQIPLAPESRKYCGVATPFKGVRVYMRSAMGMPGSETALEELMCRVLGPLLQEGGVAKIADDLYCGGDTPQELLRNWRSVLHALQRCDLRLSASKTVVNPQTASILGWIWSSGSLTASPHRINTLASCPLPDTVGHMRSFVGAYKVLSRVVPRASAFLSPLDDVTAGRQSAETIEWCDELRDAFLSAQRALTSARAITLPRPSEQLWIVTDGAVRQPGLGATMYVTRGDTLRLAGFFSAKLRGSQTTWLPCEVEALSIAAATKHFSPYIIQSGLRTCILTDSKPCVQAYEKLCRGEFSASPRVSTFLSVVSRYQVSVRHVSGAAILPADFASRNAPVCEEENCRICAFVKQTSDSVVRQMSVHDVLDGSARLPFTSRPAWLITQSECPDLRRTRAHLKQGTRPSKKLTNIRDVKRYLTVATVAADGLLVVKRDVPFAPSRECIIVPRQVLDGLLTALHIQLAHPTCHQLKTVVKRYLYALDMDKAIERVTDQCHPCAALRRFPTAKVEQTSSPPPDAIGVSFAADVLKRARQVIFVLRETVTSFTSTLIIPDERQESLRDALIHLCVHLRPMDGPPAVVRTDPAPGFKALNDDGLLRQHRVTLELGQAKNPNKNPVAEKAVQELTDELLRLNPLGGPVSPRELSVATAALNSRIRSRGLSAREMWTQRDQFSNAQLPVRDAELAATQRHLRNINHAHSETSKAPHTPRRAVPALCVGDVVYVHSDRDKSRARDRYLVVAVEPPFCNIRKFAGSQLRSASYRMRMSDCFKVPSEVCETVHGQRARRPADEIP